MKRRLWLAVVVLDVLGIALIPLNLFALQMPEAVTLIFVPAAAVLNVLLWRGGTGGRGAKAALSLLSLAAAALTLFGAYCNPYWNSNTFRADALKTVRDDAMVLTGREALADLDYAMKYLKKLHPAFYRGAPPAASAQYELARQELAGMEKVDLCTLSREIEPVLATLGDAHTYALAVYRRAHRLKYLDEREAAGERVVAVNGVSVDELLAQNARLFSYETEAYGRLWAENRLRSLEGLRYLGIDTDGGVAYTFARADGTKETLTFYSDDFTVEDSGADDAPFVSYELDRGHDLAVLRLDRCVYNDAYRDCLAEFFAAVRANGISNVAVDLRNNGGGNSLAADELIRYLNVRQYRHGSSEWRLGPFLLKNEARTVENRRYTENTFCGKLYVLTSARSFSAAVDFAMLVKDNRIGTLIGEEPGNLPDSYGDAAFFALPHSNIFMQISTKSFHRVDGSAAGRPVEPDIPCAAEDAERELYQKIAERP